MNRRLILAFSAILAIGACSDQQEPNIDTNPESEFAKTSGTKPINVVTKTRTSTAQLAELAKYGTVHKQIVDINAVIMSGKESSMAAIRALPFVAGVSTDAERNAPPLDAVAVADFAGGFSTWNLDAVNATVSPGPGTRTAGLGTGEGVYVAILDTGLLPTWRSYFPDERIAAQYARSFGGAGNDRGNVSEQPNKWEHDVNSHGTHVTSTVIGFSLFGTSFNGVAPKATIIPVKVLNQNGSGWSSVIAEGITYIANLKAGALAGKPVVINMSLGGSVLDVVEKAAIDYAILKGVIIVASAGNSGERGMGYPGAYQPVISAAATGWTHQWTCGGAALRGDWWFACDVADPTNPNDSYIAGFSSREQAGQDLDVAAPGAWVVGPYQLNQSGKLSYYYLSGTSMASPHVAGIAALMAQKNNGLTGPQAELILTGSAIPLPPGSRTIATPSGTSTVTWGADATGSGLATADAAVLATP